MDALLRLEKERCPGLCSPKAAIRLQRLHSDRGAQEENLPIGRPMELVAVEGNR